MPPPLSSTQSKAQQTPSILSQSNQVKSTKDTFIEIFSELERQGLKNGVIKIDVEGFERVVLMGLFENLDEDFDFDELKDVFTARNISLRKIDRSLIGTSHSRIYKIISLFVGRVDKYRLTQLDDTNSVVGDIVMEVLPTQ